MNQPRALRWAAVAMLGASALNGPVALAATTVAPLSPYPVSRPGPLGSSVLPAFLDDDELVRARVDNSGRVEALIDDVILKLRGSGDFVVQLPEPVKNVTDNGGDSPPGLQDGRITFLGHVDGTRLLASEATLDPAIYSRRIPITTSITYSDGGTLFDPSSRLGRPATVEEHLLVTNLTSASTTIVRGTPSGAAGRAGLAQALDALRQVPALFTPELDLQTVLPMPSEIPITAAGSRETVTTMAPFRLLVTVRLPAGAQVDSAGGAAVSADKGGTRMTWTIYLPLAPGGAPTVDVAWSFHETSFAIPSVDLLAVGLPYPAGTYTAPGGASWAGYLQHGDSAAALRQAELGAAALNRLGDLAPLIGRPGPGPVRVQYDFFLPSKQAATAAPSRRTSPGPQPWAVALVAIAALAAGLNLWWAWSRH